MGPSNLGLKFFKTLIQNKACLPKIISGAERIAV
jgi:hypothetical protein